MPVVYRLATELERDPERVRLAQALTLDASRPTLGLKGAHGLHGSAEWFENIRLGIIRSEQVSGVIQRLVRAGMDAGPKPNSFEMICDDGTSMLESIYANVGDRRLYQPGKLVRVTYICDELKALDRMGVSQFSRTPFEIWIGDTN